MSAYLWTRSALTAGDVLTVRAAIPGKSIIQARMDWPGEAPIISEIAMSIDEALNSLEAKLADDAADQHLQNSGT